MIRWGLVAVVCTVATLACHRRHHEPVEGPSTNPPTVSVDDVLAMQLSRAEPIQVRGRCLDKLHARSLGPPPVSRSDWQLASDAAAIFVSGPQPADCDGNSLVTVAARVYTDTIRAPIGVPRERRYLVTP
jgi:hypothetical protein